MITFKDFLNEKAELTCSIEPRSVENYWKKVLVDKYALDVLNTIVKQKYKASERQMNILRKSASGDKTPYHPKN